MATGIFNPYVEKKEPPQPGGAEEVIPGDIRLDGDSYVLELQQVDVKDIPARLGALLTDVMVDHRHVLVRHGIDILPRGETRQLEENEVSLPTPAGHLCVYIGDPEDDTVKTEVKVFRRIACALREVPRKILVKNRAKILERV
jgi:hypothetical protein